MSTAILLRNTLEVIAEIPSNAPNAAAHLRSSLPDGFS